jgi:DNA-directed RNA polymerase specialized sigma24 family protein
VLGIARNVVRDHLRARRRWGWLPLDWLGDRPAPGPTPEQAAIQNEQQQRLLEAVDLLLSLRPLDELPCSGPTGARRDER